MVATEATLPKRNQRMIVLFLKAIDENNQIREFVCQIYELETALGALSAIAAQGNKILEAYIIEEGKRTHLSTQAFDHQDLIRPIRQLQRELKLILA